MAVVRELTKLHEEVLRGTVEEIAAQLSAREVLGEIVVVLEGAPTPAPVGPEVVAAALSERLARGATVRDAVAEVVDELGVARRETYALALGLRANEVP